MERISPINQTLYIYEFQVAVDIFLSYSYGAEALVKVRYRNYGTFNDAFFVYRLAGLEERYMFRNLQSSAVNTS